MPWRCAISTGRIAGFIRPHRSQTQLVLHAYAVLLARRLLQDSLRYSQGRCSVLLRAWLGLAVALCMTVATARTRVQTNRGLQPDPAHQLIITGVPASTLAVRFGLEGRGARPSGLPLGSALVNLVRQPDPVCAPPPSVRLSQSPARRPRPGQVGISPPKAGYRRQHRRKGRPTQARAPAPGSQPCTPCWATIQQPRSTGRPRR